jgi:D-glycero-D-manno-heptose 1,7-bisphosphate phosphatase
MNPDDMFPALFLDRDGIINFDSGFVWKKEEFMFQDCIFELCRYFKEKGFKLVTITNQSGIGRGLFSLEDFHRLNDWMLSRFEEEGCGMDLVLASTLDPTDQSATIREKSFRKPAPGMLLAAQEILNLNLRDSLLIGDRESDIEAGVNAGVGNLFLVNPDLVLDGNCESFEGLYECLVRLKEKFQ